MAKCHRCGSESEKEERIVEITCLKHLFIFFRRTCADCGTWIGDRLHPSSEFKPKAA